MRHRGGRFLDINQKAQIRLYYIFGLSRLVIGKKQVAIFEQERFCRRGATMGGSDDKRQSDRRQRVERRSGEDRRRANDPAYSGPERRSGTDRRSSAERRSGADRRSETRNPID